MAGGGGVYAGGGVVVVMDPAPLVYLKIFHTGSGPDRSARRNATKVAALARELVPVSSGRLKSTISASQNRNERGRFAFGYTVSAGTSYAVYVHEGTSPSPRWPNDMKVMHWPGRQGDRPYRDFVMHPGTPAQPFLQDALAAMAGG
jgi:hypothetical protein